MLNVRLNNELDKKLAEYSQENEMSKSAVVKEALAMYFTAEQASQSPYDLGADLFGSDSSGRADASSTFKTKLKNKLRAKHSN